MNNQYMSIKQFSEHIGKSCAWIYRKRGTGEIPEPVRIGATLRWDRKAVDSWLSGLTRVGKRNRKQRTS